MGKTNFLTTLNIFLEDDLRNFTLIEVFHFLAENSIEFPNMFKGIYSYLLKEKNSEKIRINLIENIPKIIILAREAIEKLEIKKGLNADKIEEFKLIIQVLLMIDIYLKSKRFRVFKVVNS